ncbi:MAG: helix-turn-helix domain-containing protein [Gammaproteobacteria bacterium]|nr:helix-turn-helix domain-containing protein [Gammaproteobacteria bacterium]
MDLEFADSFGRRFRRLQKKSDLTQGQVAKFIASSTATVSNWENGLIPAAIFKLYELQKNTGWDMNYLISGKRSRFIDVNDLWQGNQLIMMLAANLLRRVETSREKSFAQWWEDNKDWNKSYPPRPPWESPVELPPEYARLFDFESLE